MPLIKGEVVKKTPPAQTVAPVPAPRSPGAIKTSIEPVAPVMPTGPPVQILQTHGFNGSIHDFNDRVQSVHDQYQQAYGVAPSPGLTFDLARSPVDTAQFSKLFTVPLSQQAAKARAAITSQGLTAPSPVFNAKQLAGGIMEAATHGDYHQFVTERADVIHDLSYQNKGDAAVIAGAVFKARRLAAFRDVETKVNNGEMSHFQGQEQLRAAGFIPGGSAFHALKGVGGVIALSIGQIAEGLVHSPAGTYELARAIGLDSRDIVLHPSLAKAAALTQGPTGLSKDYPRTAKMGKAMAEGTKEDVLHPLRNPGYLFLDALGLVSGVGSGVARVGEAGRLLLAGEGAGAASKALLKKPGLQSFTLRHGELAEEMPLSQNTVVAAAQKVVLNKRQSLADARMGGDVPSGLKSFLMPQLAQDFLDTHLSFETKIGRLGDVRKRVDYIVDTSLARELDHVAGRSVMLSRMDAAVPSKIRGALTRGEQKAIQVQSWDIPGDEFAKLAAERDFHQRMIDSNIGDPKAHRTQLADLKLAEKALANPSPRLVKALELTRRVVADMEAIKINDLGLLPETAEGRVAKAGAVLRGDPLVAEKAQSQFTLRPLEPTGKFLNQDGTEFNAKVAELSKPHDHLEHENLHDAKGNVVGTIAYDARPGRRKVYVESVYIKPEYRNSTEAFKELTRKVIADGRPIDATFENPKLGRLFDKMVERARKEPKPGPAEKVALTKQNPDSFYLPTQLRGKVKRPPSASAGFYSPKLGPYGLSPGRDMPELTHQFNGKAIEAGPIRIDATNLASEAYGRTVRAASVKAAHQEHWDAASATPYGRHSIAVRDVNAIPDKLREVVAKLDEGDFTPQDAEILPQDMRDLLESLYPDPKKLTEEEIQHVRWLDARVLGEGVKNQHVPGLAARLAQGANAPLRFTTLYLRPAYILNKLGNHAMGVLDEGWMWPGNFAKAMKADERYGEENTRTIRNLVGAGKSKSYVTKSSGKVSQAVADFWNRVADRDERVASFIHYMEKKGYKSKEDVTRLLNDPASRADLVEITTRGNNALVGFDNLLPIEKNYLRHFIFVYPWVSRSAVWSIRTALEHPIKTDALAQLGRYDQEHDALFGHAVSWFKRVGYIPVGFNHDGTVRVVNPTSVNSFSTIGDFLALAKGASQGDKYASAADFLGPAPKFLIHAVTGRDDQGNQYPGSQWWGAAKETLQALPQVAAFERKGKFKDANGKPMSVADRASLETSLNANLKKTVMSPGWLGGYGSFFAGGFSPRDVNMSALAARYWSDQDPAVRHARELDLLNRALNIQGTVLKQDVPPSVRSAVADMANLDFGYKKFLKETGRAPTDKERASYTITYLMKQGLMPKGAASEWRTKLAPLADTSDISRLKNHLLDKYANGKALREWDTSIRTVASFSKPVFAQKLNELFNQGLADKSKTSASQDVLYDYGRKYLAFTQEAKKMHAGGASAAELRAFQDKNDVPVNGLPSFVRIAWANQTPEEQQAAVQSATVRSWSSLTAFDKTLLGRPSDAKVTEGWAKLKEFEATQRAEAKRQGRSYPAVYTRTLAQYVEKNFDAPGLVKDYDFSKQPLYQRMKYLAPIENSPNKDTWTQLFALADHQYKAIKSGNYSGAQLRQQWTDYVSSPGFQEWIAGHQSFKAELDGYGKKTLVSLIGS